jgi:hypothetical protein
MFIYACAHSLAKKRNLNYCLSDINHLKYFELSDAEAYSNTIKFKTFQIYNKIKPFKFEHFQDNRIDYSSSMLSEQETNIWYYGYFQGEKYFYDNYPEIKKRLQIKSIYQKQYNLIVKQFQRKKILTVHIRLKDYKTFGPDYLNGPDMTLPFSYYHKLLKTFKTEDYQLVFISDEIALVKKEFQHFNQAYFSTNEAIVDFQFIKNADIALISHSTFAWWGAWLNENPQKQIYVPEYFLGFKVGKEYPINIIPSDWKKIKCN